MLLLLFACAPDPGAPGDEDCVPYPAGQNCSIWECWSVDGDGGVAYRYKWGWSAENGGHFESESDPCHSPNTCAREATYAANHGCGDAS